MKAPRPFGESLTATISLNDYLAVLHKFNSEIVAWRSEWQQAIGEPNSAAIPDAVKESRRSTKL